MIHSMISKRTFFTYWQFVQKDYFSTLLFEVNSEGKGLRCYQNELLYLNSVMLLGLMPHVIEATATSPKLPFSTAGVSCKVLNSICSHTSTLAVDKTFLFGLLFLNRITDSEYSNSE